MNIPLRKQLSLTLASCLFLISAPVDPEPAASSPTHVRQETQLLALTNEWIAAINHKDRPKLEFLMAPNFVLHAWDESWTGDRSTWLKNLFERLQLDEYRHWSIVPRIYGDTGLVTSQWYWRGKRDGKPFENHGYVLDVWQHKMNRWQVVSRVTISEPGKE